MLSPLRPRSFLATATALFLATSASHAADLLHAGKPLPITGTHGRFDFLTIDAKNRRLLAAHTGNGSLDLIDLDKESVVKVIAVGAAQSSAVGADSAAYYVAVSKPPHLAIVDATKFTVTGTVPLTGPADLMAFSAKTGHAYVGHDDGKELWVIDPAQKKITGTVELPGEAPEDLAFDTAGTRLFQAMKIGNVMAVIDVATGKVTEKWPTAPAEGPHGIALVPEADAIAIAGANGKLALMSQKDGHILSSVEIAKGVDQVAYDADLHRVYCASNTGKISVIGVEKDKLTVLGDVATSAGAKSIALDAKTHTVWIAYAKGEASFVQPFTPPAQK
jgi:DNA-binding beta-propeller fold protein YncE